MDNMKLGHKTLTWFYSLFSNYFKKGDIVVTGSFYYKKLGCDINPTYKDVDIAVNKEKEHLIYDIVDTVKSVYKLNHSMVDKFDGEAVGSFSVDGYSLIDLLVSDFSDLRDPIEIIPNVWTYGLSDKVLYEIHKILEHKRKEAKYTVIKDFFYERTLRVI